MGFFDLFRRKNSIDLKEWQDILLINEKKIIYSKKQLEQMSKLFVDRKFQIATESLNIVNNTCNIDTYFSRLQLIIDILGELSRLEKFIPFNNSPTTELNRIIAEKDSNVKEFIERAWNSMLEKNSDLKTDKAKINRMTKFLSKFDRYTNELGPLSNDYLKNLKSGTPTSTIIVNDNCQNNTSTNRNSNKDSWIISVSFGKSTSSNYQRAIFLAKESKNYSENGDGKSIVHQATYSSATDDYLEFIKLYQIVCDWKSSFVFINGTLTDKKIVGKLNYCYGDKCRSGNKSFCFGASEYTQNPLGCHRLQISNNNNPWWSFGKLDKRGIWHVDKKAILERINEKYSPYEACPSFSIKKVIDNVNKLPSTIDCNLDSNWVIMDNKIYPKSEIIHISC